jgi:hypothetical protein
VGLKNMLVAAGKRHEGLAGAENIDWFQNYVLKV